MELKTKYNLGQIVYAIGGYSESDKACLEINKGKIVEIDIKSKNNIIYKVSKNSWDNSGYYYPEEHIYLADEVEPKVHEFIEENKQLDNAIKRN